MFQDLDATLAAMFGDAKAPPEVRAADVAFDTPAGEYRPGQLTLNLFLHEVTENRTLRDEARISARSGDTWTSRMPPLRVDCTYLVTAWSVQAGGLKAAEEHQVLGQALRWMGRFPVIDERFLRGVLATPEQAFPLPAAVARTTEGRSAGEFWSALGIAPRAALTLTVTVTVDPYDESEQFAAVQEIHVRNTSVRDPMLSGLVLGHGRAPAAAATVTVVETGATATAGPDGAFSVPGLAFGDYTLRVAPASGAPEQIPISYRADRQTHTVVLAGP